MVIEPDVAEPDVVTPDVVVPEVVAPVVAEPVDAVEPLVTPLEEPPWPPSAPGAPGEREPPHAAATSAIETHIHRRLIHIRVCVESNERASLAAALLGAVERSPSLAHVSTKSAAPYPDSIRPLAPQELEDKVRFAGVDADQGQATSHLSAGGALQVVPHAHPLMGAAAVTQFQQGLRHWPPMQSPCGQPTQLAQ